MLKCRSMYHRRLVKVGEQCHSEKAPWKRCHKEMVRKTIHDQPTSFKPQIIEEMTGFVKTLDEATTSLLPVEQIMDPEVGGNASCPPPYIPRWKDVHTNACLDLLYVRVIDKSRSLLGSSYFQWLSDLGACDLASHSAILVRWLILLSYCCVFYTYT